MSAINLLILFVVVIMATATVIERYHFLAVTASIENIMNIYTEETSNLEGGDLIESGFSYKLWSNVNAVPLLRKHGYQR